MGENPVVFNNNEKKIITDNKFWINLENNTIEKLNQIIEESKYKIY